ncbi:ribosomal RNA processing protein 1 homolog B [Ctenodactylus gundi]
MQPAEIQFAQRLASSERGVRDRAVRRLRQYLSVKTQRETGGFSQEELLKIWKGLFYCMWVQDEPPLQEELASTISQLVHVVNTSEAQHLFIQTFWQTMTREWEGIDTLRLDKFHMLIRLVLRQSFEVLKQDGWEESRIKLFLDVLMKEILCPANQSPSGVTFHLVDIYLDELSRVGGKELLADQNLRFIDPFCRIAAETKDHTLVQTIAKGVFGVIVDQSPFVPEAVVEEQSMNGAGGRDSEGETPADKMPWIEGIRTKAALGKCHSKKDGVSDDRERGDYGAFEDTRTLQFDYKAVADRLLEVTSRKHIPPFNRKRLCKLIKNLGEAAGQAPPRWLVLMPFALVRSWLEIGVFQDLSAASSTSPLCFSEDSPADEDGQALKQGRYKKKRRKLVETAGSEMERGNKFSLASVNDHKGSIQKRKRKKKKKKHLQPEACGPEDTATSLAQGWGSEPAWEEGRAEHLPSTQVHNQRKQPRRKGLKAQGKARGSTALTQDNVAHRDGSCGPPEAPAPRGSIADGSPVPKRKQKLGVLLVNGSGPVALAKPPASLAEGKDGQASLACCRSSQKRKAEPSSLDLCCLSSHTVTVLKKRKKIEMPSSLVEHNGVLRSTTRKCQPVGSSRTLSPLKKPQRTENNFVKFDTPFLPKSLFFRKSKSAAATCTLGPAIQLNKAPSSAKKVTFRLNRNMTAEFKKTDKSILVSPTGPSRVAFNPEQRPLYGVLKMPARSPVSTPLPAQKPLATTPQRRPRAMDFF